MNKKEIIVNKEKRNYGIDLLRVFSMFLIINLHSLLHGGVLNNLNINTLQYNVMWLIEIFAYCAVDIFALITGYVYYSDEKKKFKYSNYIKLWFEVVFYNLLITILFIIINKQTFNLKIILNCFFPIVKNSYWYFTSYTGLFFLIPVLNAGIRNIENNKLKKYFIVLFLLFSVFDTIFKRFNLINGYTVIWLSLLYILGAIIKKCNIGKDLKQYQALMIIFLLGLITFAFFKYGFETDLIKKDILISYTSPTILGMAIIYLISASKMKFNNIFKKSIKFISSSAFAIYLINDSFLIRENYIKNSFVGLVNQLTIKSVFYLLAFAIVFLILSVLIDKIRILIFKLLRIDKLSEKIENIINLIFSKIVK